MMIQKTKQNKGFVILFAILISALVLTIGVGIFRITLKETILSSAARESMIAFFASDGGLECALREANVRGGFVQVGSSNSFVCAGETIPYSVNPDIQSSFRVKLPEGCAYVSVDKKFIPVDATALHTQIISRGYNVCIDESPDIGDPVLLERVLELTYPNF